MQRAKESGLSSFANIASSKILSALNSPFLLGLEFPGISFRQGSSVYCHKLKSGSCSELAPISFTGNSAGSLFLSLYRPNVADMNQEVDQAMWFAFTAFICDLQLPTCRKWVGKPAKLDIRTAERNAVNPINANLNVLEGFPILMHLKCT